MPPNPAITKEFILEKAFNLVREQGYQQLTARNLASYMNCSTMPIYSQIKNMQDLEREVAQKTLKIFFAYQCREWHREPILSVSLGTLHFFLEERELFKIMMVNDDPSQRETRLAMHDLGHNKLLEFIMEKTELNEEKKKVSEILRKMMIFTLGLAVSYVFQPIRVESEELVHLLEGQYRLLTE